MRSRAPTITQNTHHSVGFKWYTVIGIGKGLRKSLDAEAGLGNCTICHIYWVIPAFGLEEKIQKGNEF